MEEIHPGDLVKVATGGPEIDGIVFDVPSHSKVVVALVDSSRGPVFRTVTPDALSERGEESPGDPALRALMQRTPLPDHGASRGGKGGGHGRSGHSRPPAHRPTGR